MLFISIALLGIAAMIFIAYIATLLLRPTMGARAGAQFGKGSFFVETKDGPHV